MIMYDVIICMCIGVVELGTLYYLLFTLVSYLESKSNVLFK
jgi:hypothetical protein